MTPLLRPAANDNSPFSADFSAIPETFLRAYQNEIFAWNPVQGNLCTIDLWNPPGSSVLSVNWQGRVTLQCDAYGHQITKKMKFVVRPASEEDAARIARHCEQLPAIMAQHKAAAQAKAGTRPKMARWVFDGTVPEYFVLRYQSELRAWVANLPKIGLTKHIILREGALSNVSPDPEQGAELVQVTLVCRIERWRGDEIEIVVSAQNEEQKRRIRKHCEKMEAANVPAGALLVEPDRPGLPMFPTIHPHPVNNGE